jgi:hypothetical protein
MICKKCGQNVQDGVAFCPACGENLAEVQQPAPAPAPEKTAAPAPTGWRKIVGKIGIGAAIATVAFALIFLFTVGIEVTVTMMGISATEQVEGGLFCYFNTLSNLIKTIEANPNISIESILTSLVCSLFGMIATLALLIITLIFGIIALVKSIKAISKGVENNYLKFAGITFAVFFVLSVAFGAISSVKSENMIMGVNGAGVAGIVLSGIFLLASIGCKIAVDVKSYINVKTIMGVVGTGVKAICVLLMICFMTYTITATTGGKATDYSAFQALGLIPLYQTLTDAQATALGLVIITDMFFIFMMIIMISNVNNTVHDLSTMKTKISLRMPITTIVFALIYMILSLSAAGSLQDLFKGGSTTYSAVFPIVIFVLSLVNLAGAIVRNVGAKKLA